MKTGAALVCMQAYALSGGLCMTTWRLLAVRQLPNSPSLVAYRSCMTGSTHGIIWLRLQANLQHPEIALAALPLVLHPGLPRHPISCFVLLPRCGNCSCGWLIYQQHRRTSRGAWVFTPQWSQNPSGALFRPRVHDPVTSSCNLSMHLMSVVICRGQLRFWYSIHHSSVADGFTGKTGSLPNNTSRAQGFPQKLCKEPTPANSASACIRTCGSLLIWKLCSVIVLLNLIAFTP